MSDFLENYKLEGKELEIHTFPDPVLTTVASKVEDNEFNEELEELVQNMLFTMYNAPGIGLAAPQIGISKRLFVMDIEYDRTEEPEDSENFVLSNFKPLVFINPEFIKTEGKTKYQEGCLSLPGIYEDVERYNDVVIKYQNVKGETLEMEADGLLSICAQHENDHLDGIVFLDRLSGLKRNFLKKKLIKEKKKYL